MRSWAALARVLYENRPSPDGFLVLGVTVAGAAVLAEAATRTSLGDAESASACRYPPASDVLTAEHVRELERGSIVILRNVLPPAILLAARAEAASLGLRGLLSPDNHGNAADVRQDRICWVREDDSVPHCDGMTHCIKTLRGLPFLLARHGYARAHSFVVPRQCQLACYSPASGAGYTRHLDRCTLGVLDMGLLGWCRARDYRHRTVTAILYLNDPEWEGGGSLRCFGTAAAGTGAAATTADGGAEAFHDVAPAGGTLVLFDASLVEHQVLPSRGAADRFALTCWINGELSAV